jgi:hypothetical protein
MLIDRVVLSPDAADGLRAELHGGLAENLALGDPAGLVVGPRRAARINEERPRTDVRGRQLSVVAGTGFEPVTFRL